MKRFQKKLISQRGASITFALLLFLVCAVASSVVIIAGTTAAGRMSQQAQTDQRYYAVASAVELLREDFNNKTVKVPYTLSEGKPTIDGDAVAISSTDTKASLPEGEQHPLVIDITKALIESIVAKKDSTALHMPLKVEENTLLNCDIDVYLKRDGRAIFQVSNATAADVTNKYTLSVTFTATISESKNTVGGVTTYTTTVDWRLGDIRKGITEGGG